MTSGAYSQPGVRRQRSEAGSGGRQQRRNGGRRPVPPGVRRRIDPATFELDDSMAESRARDVFEWVGILAIAVISALLVKTFVVQPFWIPSESMEPTLMTNDRILVQKVTYRFSSVKRGDIIVFNAPPAELEQNPDIKVLVKRVIGLPGDQVEAYNGILYLNGKPLPEEYLPSGTVTKDLPLTIVPEGQMWMMGDNRTRSGDSRYFGAVDEDLVIGKVFFRVWPLKAVGFT